ncbi:MAG: hypothetical protein ACKVOP_00640 [Sphingomonadaceae bacterium]
MPTPDDIIARAGEVLERHRVGDRVVRAQKSIARRLRRAGLTGIAVLLAAFVYGAFVAPLGITGVLAVALLLLLATSTALLWPTGTTVRVPAAATLPKTPIAQLPDKTGSWLAGQRLALPAPARALADDLGARIAALGPQLQTIPEDAPQAAQVRRLLAEDLPGLVEGYARVPAGLRKDGIDGMSPDKQLVEGLDAIGSELKRVSEDLARGSLESLATQGKYLEYKYRGDSLN